MNDVIHKRLIGIARFWQRRFHMPYESLEDLVQEAWALWLERPTVEAERRFDQVNSGLRRVVLRDIFGVTNLRAKPRSPILVYDLYVGKSYTDFDGYVELSNIVKTCNVAPKPADHKTTLAMIAGFKKPCKPKAFSMRVARLRTYLTKVA